MTALINPSLPTLAEHHAARQRGYADARWGAERPRVSIRDPLHRSYMIGWRMGAVERAEAEAEKAGR